MAASDDDWEDFPMGEDSGDKPLESLAAAAAAARAPPPHSPAAAHAVGNPPATV
ncbi:hypothetical protein HJC23_005830 [Cyclotella cryptica]|uniref:Uncharacterized protein n=1 Tax=Cyclotella cryptica TaxID=29204 RepID=A0ABD3R419_9STRA